MTVHFSKKDAMIALDAYGANLALWPDQDLAEFVKTNPAFHDALKDAAKIDSVLSDYTPPPIGHELAQRILQTAAQTPQDKRGLKDGPAPKLEVKNVVSFASKHKTTPPTGPFLRAIFTRIAAGLTACLAIGLGAVHVQSTKAADAILIAEMETDAARQIANELGLADIFLWVEVDEAAGA